MCVRECEREREGERVRWWRRAAEFERRESRVEEEKPGPAHTHTARQTAGGRRRNSSTGYTLPTVLHPARHYAIYQLPHGGRAAGSASGYQAEEPRRARYARLGRPAWDEARIPPISTRTG